MSLFLFFFGENKFKIKIKMKEVSKDFYSRNNASTYSEKVQGSSSYDSSTGKTTVTHYED